MRICANYAYMRILCVDAQMMRICAEYAYMRILRVYAPYGRGSKTLRIPRENGPGAKRCGFLEKTAPGAGGWGPVLDQPPPSPVSFSLYFKATGNTYIYLPTRSPRRPEGAADFPCLRQLPPPPEKNVKTKGSKRVMEGGQKYSASKEGTLRPSREGTKGIIFLPILERESKSMKNQ